MADDKKEKKPGEEAGASSRSLPKGGEDDSLAEEALQAFADEEGIEVVAGASSRSLSEKGEDAGREEEEGEQENQEDPRLVRIKALVDILDDRSDRTPHALARIATKFDESLMVSWERSKSPEEFLDKRLPIFCKTINSRAEDTGIEMPPDKVKEVYRPLCQPDDEEAKVEGGEEKPKLSAPAGPVPVVEFDHVTKTYSAGTRRAFTAIKDVHFTVEDLPDQGEFISVLGPSGCGKSTVLRLIAGLEPQHPPTLGSVKVFGQEVRSPGADRGMVFQSYTSFDNRTVLRNITFGLECRGGMSRKERDELAREWIDKVGLSVRADQDKYPHQLSGGMQQRVAIARTLILRPKIILMDEPFGALDPVTRMRMQDLLVALWREVEATVFFITHSIDEAVYVGDRVFLFSRSPGTITRQIQVPPPDRPAMEMQRDPEFQNQVFELRETIDRLEREAEAEQDAREEAAAEDEESEE